MNQEFFNRMKLLMEYDTSKTMTENKSVIKEQALARLIMGQADNVLDDVARGFGKRVVTTSGKAITSGPALKRAVQAGQLSAQMLGKVRVGLLKSSNINLAGKTGLIDDFVKAPSVIRKYQGLTKPQIKAKFTAAGYADDVADDIATKLTTKGGKAPAPAPTGVKPAPKGGKPVPSKPTAVKPKKTATGKTKNLKAKKKPAIPRDKRGRFISQAKANPGWPWSKWLKWGAGIGLGAAALWWLFFSEDGVPVPDDIPDEQQDDDNNGGDGSRYRSCSGTYTSGCMANAIAEVQACFGLTNDGKWGPKTDAVMKSKGITSFTDADVAKFCKKTDPDADPYEGGSADEVETDGTPSADFSDKVEEKFQKFGIHTILESERKKILELHNREKKGVDKKYLIKEEPLPTGVELLKLARDKGCKIAKGGQLWTTSGMGTVLKKTADYDSANGFFVVGDTLYIKSDMTFDVVRDKKVIAKNKKWGCAELTKLTPQFQKQQDVSAEKKTLKDNGWQTKEELYAQNITDLRPYEQKTTSDGTVYYKLTSKKDVFTQGLGEKSLTDEQNAVIADLAQAGYIMAKDIPPGKKGNYEPIKLSQLPKGDFDLSVFKDDLTFYYDPRKQSGLTKDYAAGFEKDRESQTVPKDTCRGIIENFFGYFEQKQKPPVSQKDALKRQAQSCVNIWYGKWGAFGGGKKLDQKIDILRGRVTGQGPNPYDESTKYFKLD